MHLKYQIFGWNFVYSISGPLVFSDIKKEKNPREIRSLLGNLRQP